MPETVAGQPAYTEAHAKAYPVEYMTGIDLYNAGEFHAAHDAWEERWLGPVGPAEKLFLQAMIQSAVAFHHLEIGRPGAARRMHQMAKEKFARLGTPHFMSLDLEDYQRATRPRAVVARRGRRPAHARAARGRAARDPAAAGGDGVRLMSTKIGGDKFAVPAMPDFGAGAAADAGALSRLLKPARTTRLQRALHGVRLLLVAVWLGGAVFFSAAVAPSAFAVLPSRELAGAHRRAHARDPERRRRGRRPRALARRVRRAQGRAPRRAASSKCSRSRR